MKVVDEVKVNGISIVVIYYEKSKCYIVTYYKNKIDFPSEMDIKRDIHMSKNSYNYTNKYHTTTLKQAYKRFLELKEALGNVEIIDVINIS